MPRPVKSERPVIAEPVVEAIQGTTIVVIHPGSSVLQIGRSTDHFPQAVPHVIARRLPPNAQHKLDSSLLYRPGIHFPECESMQESGLSSANQIIHSMRISCGQRKPTFTIDQVSKSGFRVVQLIHLRQSTSEQRLCSLKVTSFNKSENPEAMESENVLSWTDISDSPSILIGEQAQYLDPEAPYQVCWPMKYGQLNIHSGPGGSLTSVLSDIEALWSRSIEQYLDIPVKDLKHYRAVLIVPDIFNRQHVKCLIELLLNNLCFSCVIIHQESVCATFGSGVSSACVVDVGDQKTSICCVEDGISIPTSRLRINYGGNDITRVFYWLLKKRHFPYKECDINDKLDVYLLHELKETFGHLSMEIVPGQVHEFQVYRPNETSLLYNIKLGDEPLQAAVSLFCPRLFGIIKERLVYTSPEQSEHDPSDLTDDRFLLELQYRDTSSKKGKSDVDGTTEIVDKPPDVIALPRPAVVMKSKVLANCEMEGLPIDQAILESIDCCGNPETKRKMYSTILIVGGGLMFNGAEGFLLKRLQAQLPTNYQFLRDQVEVIVRPKDLDPRTVCWKGGAVLAILDSAQELWISQKEWNQYGVRIVRERCAFQWSTNSADK